MNLSFPHVLFSFFLLFAGPILSLRAQLPHYIQETLDSLETELAASNSIVKQTEIRSEMANYLMSGMPDSSFAVAEQNISIAETSGDSLALGVAWMGLGRLSALGKGAGPAEGSNALNKAQSLLIKMEDEYYLGHCECMLGFCYLQLGEGELSDSLQWSGLEKTKRSGHDYAGARCLSWLCQTYAAFGEFETADSIGQELLKLATLTENERAHFDSYTLMGRNKMASGNPTQAIHYYLEAAEFASLQGNTTWEGVAYQQLTFSYDRMEEFEKAKNSALKALSLLGESDAAYLALGGAYLNVDQPDSAVYYLEKIVQMKQGPVNPARVIPAYLNLSEAYLSTGENQKALEAVNKVEILAKEAKFDLFLYAVNEKKAWIYNALNNLPLALKYANRALVMAQEIDDINSIQESYYQLYVLQKKRGNPSEALAMYEKYIEIQEEIVKEENIRKLSSMEEAHKYNLKSAQDSIKATEQILIVEGKMQLEKERADLQVQRTLYLAIGLGVLVLFLGFLIWLFSVTRKQKVEIEGQKNLVDTAYSQLQKRDQEKELLLKEIHHRVKNNLQVISSLLDLQAMEIEDDKAIIAVEDGQNRVKAMALIHEKLYQNDNLALINIEEYTSQLFEQIASIFPEGNGMSLQLDTARTTLDIDTAIPMGLILNELITNAFKYARKDQIDPRLSIDLQQKGNDDLLMTIADNGPGLPDEFDLKKTKSLGLRLVRNLARQLYGSVEYNYDGGAMFSIRFKSLEARKSVE